MAKRRVDKRELKRMVLAGEDISDTDYSHIKDMSYMFRGEIGLKYAPELDLSSVEGADGIFSGCVNLVSAGNLDLRRAKSVRFLFMGCERLESVGTILLNRQEKMTNMFDGCKSLSRPPEIIGARPKTAIAIFANCVKLAETPEIDFSACRDFRSSFSNCPSLNTDTMHLKLDPEADYYKMFTYGEQFVEAFDREEIISDLEMKGLLNPFIVKGMEFGHGDELLAEIAEKEYLKGGR